MRSGAIEPDRTSLLLAGGGHAHVGLLRGLAMRPVAGLRITLVSREVRTPYSGMLPALIAGRYQDDDIHIDLAALCSAAGARLIAGEIDSLDPEGRRVGLVGGRSLGYDLLSLNTGSVPGTGSLDPVSASHVLPVKPIGRFLPRWRAALDRMGPGGRVVVVGSGVGGCELALALANGPLANGHVSMVGAEADIVAEHAPGVRRRVLRALARAGVDVYRGERVVSVDATSARTDRDRVLVADLVLWVTRAAAAPWAAASGLQCDPDGFVQVDRSLRSVSHPEVFAAGDLASMTDAPRPKAGVYAVRAGPILTDSLRRAANGRPLRPRHLQRGALALIGTGDGRAIASRGPFVAEGRWLWWLKQRIDRRFMRRFERDDPVLASMFPADPTVPEALDGMRCGGCGAKLAGDLLRSVLDRLDIPTAAGVRIGVRDGDDAAVLEPIAEPLVLTIDGFRSFVDDPWWLGRLAANHALSDAWAMNARPIGVLALVTVPTAARGLMEEDLYQIMSGALEVLGRDGVALLGGHSNEGPEISIGFAVTACSREPLLHKSGLRPGDALVLTRPLGTGVLFAAAMRGLARADEIATALETMDRSNSVPARILGAHGAHALTDVTGFGLLGHVAEMVRASGHRVRIDADSVPLYPGVERLTDLGVRSTLRDGNALALADFEIDGLASGRESVTLESLIDPQTCGGLLAAVPPDRLDEVLRALSEEDVAAHVVGCVLDAPARPGRSGRVRLSGATPGRTVPPPDLHGA